MYIAQAYQSYDVDNTNFILDFSTGPEVHLSQMLLDLWFLVMR